MNYIDDLNVVRDRVCGRCNSAFIMPHPTWWNHYQCHHCNNIGRAEDFPKATVFHQITASIEVLAEKLVYCDDEGVYWHSTIIFSKMFPDCLEDFNTEDEAIAATVVRLKEVADE